MAISGIAIPFADLRVRSKTLARVAFVYGHERRAPEEVARSGRLLRSGRRSAELQFFIGEDRHERGQFHAEDGPAVLPVVRENFSAMRLNNAKANAQAQARALANRLRRVEGIEDALRILEAWTAVGEQDDDV